ncbi:glycosyltransferase family 39 protein [Candidatus Poribacteria bacterium]|nr:glycosyltransferase family 39 protein [Candidatus Poribacteria bacterium]
MLKFSTKHCPKKMQMMLLSGVVLFGAVLRFWNLEQWSFWIDEVFTVRDAQNLSFDSWRVIPNPIPYLAVKLSILIGGSSEWGSRLIPCLIGIISIPAVFGLGRTLFNWQIGLLSSAFVACSSWHLFWAQNARYPVFTFFFGVLTAWFFYTSLERDSTLLTIGALVCCLCLILSHTLAVVIVPGLAAYAVICLLERSERKRWLNLLVFFIPFAIPVLALALPDVRGYLFSGWGRNVWQRSPLYIVLTLVQGVSIPIAVTAFFAPLTTRFNRATLFLLCYGGVPLILFLIASQLQNVAGYYLFWTTPAYFILAGVACERICEKTQESRAQLAPTGKGVCERIWKATEMKPRNTLGILVPCVLLVTLLSQDYLYFKIENGGRPKWREAFEVVKAEKISTDKVVLSEPEMGRYYLSELTSIYIGGLLEDSAAFERAWEISGKDRLWFLVDVASFNVFDADVKVRNWIRQRGRMVKTLPAFSRAKDRTIHVYLLE